MSEETDTAQNNTDAAEETPTQDVTPEPTETGQVQQADTKEPESLLTEAAKPEEDGAPEQYEPFASPNEIEFDQDILNKFQDLGKNYNLSQEKMQSLVNLQAEMAEKQLQIMEQQRTELVTEWDQTNKNDPELGGGHYDQSVKEYKSGFNAVGTQGLRDLLIATGYQHHPEIFRMFVQVGRRLSEDTVEDGEPSRKDETPKPPEERLQELYED